VAKALDIELYNSLSAAPAYCKRFMAIQASQKTKAKGKKKWLQKLCCM
jgi:hypothetical protein